jgi:hypothetical protein
MIANDKTCETCYFCRMTQPLPESRPRLTCRAVPPSSREEYVWPIVPADGWCKDYARDIWASTAAVPRSVEETVIDMTEPEPAPRAKGRKS